MIDLATRDRLHKLLRREGRSLFQYLREVSPWAGAQDQNAVARMREMAGAELEVIESLGKLVQKQHGDYGHLGAFPDFTGFNDTAMHFLLPLVVVEQKKLLVNLETDRSAVTNEDVGPLMDQLLTLKRQHFPQLDELHTVPHSFTTVNV